MPNPSKSEFMHDMNETVEALKFADYAAPACYDMAHAQHFNEIHKFTVGISKLIPEFTKFAKVANYSDCLRTDIAISPKERLVFVTQMETKHDRLRFVTKRFHVTPKDVVGKTLKAFNVQRG